MLSAEGVKEVYMKVIDINREKDKLKNLAAGTPLMIRGTIHTARDTALERMLREGFPHFLKDGFVYHAGPSHPNEAGYVSCGPTTSRRMDKYLDFLFSNGLCGTIGKGERNTEENQKHDGIYLLAIGGCGALYGYCMQAMKPVLYDDLGSEAVYRADITDFPVIIAIDSMGNSIFKQ